MFLPELAQIHARIAALERLHRDTRLLVPHESWGGANPLCMLAEGRRKGLWRRLPAGRPAVISCGVGSTDGEGDASIQGIGSAVVDATPCNYFEIIARQTSVPVKSVVADEHPGLRLRGE